MFEWRKPQIDELLNLYCSPNQGVADGWNMQQAHQNHKVMKTSAKMCGRKWRTLQFKETPDTSWESI